VINLNWSRISLTFFFVIALFGSIMRLVPFSDIFINYQHLLHSHSHVAFQGWIYTALFLLITKLYLTEELILKGKYKLQFTLTIAIVIGLMVAFIFKGYALFSILFSSLFQLLNYWFTYRFFKDVKKSEKAKKHKFSLQFIKVGMFMMVLSTMGPWAVGIISAKGLAGTEYFNAALYFFLHFQYNGWFTFAILGLFFWLLEHYQIKIKQKEARLSLILFTASIIPAYALSIIGMSFRNYFIGIGYLAAIVQLIALFYIIISLIPSLKKIQDVFNSWSFLLLKFVAISFILKTILQFISILPFIEKLAFGNRFLIIDFIHLIMIGVLSFFILAIFFQQAFLKWDTVVIKTGILILILGFITSEFILMALGFSIPIYNGLFFLLISSAAMAIGVLIILIGQFSNRTTSKI